MAIRGSEPAFPRPYSVHPEMHEWAQEGMTLRDWFAGKALQGILAAPSDQISQDMGPNSRGEAEGAARYAYMFADAMLAERDKEAKP